MAFAAGFRHPCAMSEVSLWFGCRGNQILVRSNGGRPSIPEALETTRLGRGSEWVHFFGIWDGKGCYAVRLGEEVEVPPGFEWIGLRDLFGCLEEVSDAAWYSADRLPPIPPPISVARRLIDWFVDTHPA